MTQAQIVTLHKDFDFEVAGDEVSPRHLVKGHQMVNDFPVKTGESWILEPGDYVISFQVAYLDPENDEEEGDDCQGVTLGDLEHIESVQFENGVYKFTNDLGKVWEVPLYEGRLFNIGGIYFNFLYINHADYMKRTEELWEAARTPEAKAADAIANRAKALIERIGARQTSLAFVEELERMVEVAEKLTN